MFFETCQNIKCLFLRKVCQSGMYICVSRTIMCTGVSRCFREEGGVERIKVFKCNV